MKGPVQAKLTYRLSAPIDRAESTYDQGSPDIPISAKYTIGIVVRVKIVFQRTAQTLIRINAAPQYHLEYTSYSIETNDQFTIPILECDCLYPYNLTYISYINLVDV